MTLGNGSSALPDAGALDPSGTSAAAATNQPSVGRRIAVHESGHCVIARAFDLPIGGATVEAGNDFSGMAWGANRPPSLLASSDFVSEICTAASMIIPPLGESRAEASPMIAHSQCRVIELMAGQAAELLIFPDIEPLQSTNDLRQAAQYAALICVTPAAVDAFIAYARVEADALLDQHRGVLVALADALVAKRTMTGAEIDAVIGEALSQADITRERQRRRSWAAIT